MPRVLFLVNLLEQGSYKCHARVAFASARELQDFLRRNDIRERDGWSVTINRGPARGYDGKPLHHADIYLSTPLPPLEPTDLRVKDSGPESNYGRGVATESPEGRRDHLTWEERELSRKQPKLSSGSWASPTWAAGANPPARTGRASRCCQHAGGKVTRSGHLPQGRAREEACFRREFGHLPSGESVPLPSVPSAPFREARPYPAKRTPQTAIPRLLLSPRVYNLYPHEGKEVPVQSLGCW